ncbi:HTH-type transcriptional activator RhaR [Paenibacillus sp. CECT 9249]|uniref:response regulator n=1 Tax=Paenibacillus sp. CECT 9249 TaxID=2845385 RepID=UPI001E499A3F|nr:response regulator [Paenibacillus sp. CECT 9249]CAH0121840.1 HTH-type transcriptional activator RhaR [Paenibacillus sp. CECT 9249]
MIRLLIVDDEVIIRRGLSTVIDWPGLGFRLLEPADSAEEALARIAAEAPHVILTDIKMAGKTGLELIHEARKINPEVETIILTGFDDFAYAQQAIREGVSDYLLKTSRPEEIIKAVMKAKHHIMQRREEAVQDQNRRFAYRNRILERLLTEEMPDEELLAEAGTHLPRLRTEAVQGRSLQAAIVTASGWGTQPHVRSLLLFAVDNSLKELLDCETLLRADDIAVVLRGYRSSSDRNDLQRAMSHIRIMLKCDLFAALGTAVRDAAELRASYAEALHASAYQGLSGFEEIAAYEQVKDRKGGRKVCSLEEEAELASILHGGNSIELKHWVSRTMRKQLQDPDLTPPALRAFLVSAAVAGHRWLERVVQAMGKSNPAPHPSIDELQAAPERFIDPEEALFQHLLTIMDAYHKTVAEGRTSYIGRSIAYIQEHLDKHITLQQVAAAVHLHPNHFSEVFKRETGMNYLEFVTRERMRLAEELLVSSPAKISEIAKRVGYEDIKYFGQLFKKYTGKTPSEFRGKN